MQDAEHLPNYQEHPWSPERTQYACQDGQVLSIKYVEKVNEGAQNRRAPNNTQLTSQRFRGSGIVSETERNKPHKTYKVVVSSTKFNRPTDQIIKCAEGVTTLTVPQNVIKIKGGAFHNIRSIRAIVLNEGLEEIEPSSSDLTLTSKLQVYVPDDSDIEFQSYFNLYTKIRPRLDIMVGGRPLQEYRKMEEVFLPDGLEKIKNWWFADCGIRRVMVPMTVREIGSHAFQNTRMLADVRFETYPSLTTIGDYCFYNSGFTQIRCPPTVTKIGNFAFDLGSTPSVCVPQNCSIGDTARGTDLFPISTVMIGDQLLSDVRSFNAVKLPNETRKVGTCWFALAQIKEITISDSVQEFGNYAFFRCCLEKITFPSRSDLQKIGSYCFEYSHLKSFKAPASLREIGRRAFYSCTFLGSIQLNNGLVSLGEGAFSRCHIVHVKIPRTLKILDNNTFEHCHLLKKVDLPNGLERIGDNCFSDTQLSSLNIPRTVRYVGTGPHQNPRQQEQVRAYQELDNTFGKITDALYFVQDIGEALHGLFDLF